MHAARSGPAHGCITEQQQGHSRPHNNKGRGCQVPLLSVHACRLLHQTHDQCCLAHALLPIHAIAHCSVLCCAPLCCAALCCALYLLPPSPTAGRPVSHVAEAKEAWQHEDRVVEAAWGPATTTTTNISRRASGSCMAGCRMATDLLPRQAAASFHPSLPPFPGSPHSP